ncbi:MAG: restriction endonuclease subunit S [Betaproteobacteria bacterium]|nr:restriction endonuclease subunit S [Betaproteobacteria bacterium]
MNAQRLLQHFERISEAPDAVPRLRRFVLDLAVRGRLVEQRQNDEPALSRLKEPKASVQSDDEPFEIPRSWTWARVADVAECRLGKMLDKARNKGIPRRYLRNINVRWFDFDLSDVMEMRFEDFELTEFGLRHGDVLICEGGEPGRAAVWDERETDIYFQKAIHRARFSSCVHPHFFVIVLRVSADNGDLATYFTGVGIKHFTGKGLSAFQFPLPPLAEQHRIVAKVDELMALCDRLEAAQTERESRRDRLVAATHARLADPLTLNSQPSTFFVNHLPRLTTRLEHIQQLRQSILSLAVRGKLVPQNPNDDPAAMLLGDHKFCLDSENEPWKLPSGWAWSSFNLIGQTLGGGTPSKADPGFWTGPIPWVSPKDMKVDLIKDAQDHISEQAVERSAAKLIPAGSLLMVVRGMILAHSFPTAISAVPVTINQDMKAIVPFRPEIIRMLLLVTKGLKPRVLRLVLRSTHGTCKLLTGDLFSLPLPIPPLAEQHRIVAKVDELLALCARLEAQLTTSQTESRRFLEATLHEAVAGHDTRHEGALQ